METKAKKRKLIIQEIEWQRTFGATFSEIAENLNNCLEIKTIEGKKWETRNLYNFYNRNKDKYGKEKTPTE